MTALWGNYDRAALDAQYFLRGRVKNFQDFFDAYQARSDEARSSLKCEIDVAYGPSAGEKLDLFPTPSTGAPIQVFIHGGYWQSLDKSYFDYVAQGFAPHGAHAIIVNYGLTPSVDIDEIVRQLRACLAWVWRNAESFGGDRRRIYVSGHYAGGHLTAMLALTDWPAFDADLPLDLVKSGCAISGIYELEPIRLSYLNDNVRMDKAAALRNSPSELVKSAKRGAPFIFCVGGDETPEFLRQQEDFVAAYRANGFEASTIAAPGLHHFEIVAELALSDRPLHAAVTRQMQLPVRG